MLTLWVTLICWLGSSGMEVSKFAEPFGGTRRDPKFVGKIPVTDTPLTFVSIGTGMFDKSKALPFNLGS